MSDLQTPSFAKHGGEVTQGQTDCSGKLLLGVALGWGQETVSCQIFTLRGCKDHSGSMRKEREEEGGGKGGGWGERGREEGNGRKRRKERKERKRTLVLALFPSSPLPICPSLPILLPHFPPYARGQPLLLFFSL